MFTKDAFRAYVKSPLFWVYFVAAVSTVTISAIYGMKTFPGGLSLFFAYFAVPYLVAHMMYIRKKVQEEQKANGTYKKTFWDKQREAIQEEVKRQMQENPGLYNM